MLAEHIGTHCVFLVALFAPQTSEKEMIRKELGKDDHNTLQEASEDVIYKIDIPANRY